MSTVQYLAEWFVREMWEVRIDGFNPPDEFPCACADALIADGQIAPEESYWAIQELTSYWPDYCPDSLPADLPF